MPAGADGAAAGVVVGSGVMAWIPYNTIYSRRSSSVPNTEANARKAAEAAASSVGRGTAHLAILVDESESMGRLAKDVVTGLNAFLAKFREMDNVRVWLGFFSFIPDEQLLRIRVNGNKPSKVADLIVGDYSPSGLTPLNDAIIETIDVVDETMRSGEKALVVIITDGLENASVVSTDTCRLLVEEFDGRESWSFLYLGANHDAEEVAATYGLGEKGQAFTWIASVAGMRGAADVAATSSMLFADSSTKRDFQAQMAVLHDQTGCVIPEIDEDDGAL